jgi:hypothetical protein
MDRQVPGLDDLTGRVATALDRIGELQAGTRVRSDAFFSRSFMAEHTEFDTFAAFCGQSPWAFDDRSDKEGVPRDKLDEYVAARTDFET